MILENRKYISVDFKQSITCKIPKFFQYDTNVLVITVLNDGSAADLSNSDRILLNFKLSDGSVITRTVNAAGNIIEYTLGTSEQANVGIVKADLQFYDEDERLSTFIFKVQIESTINPTTPSEDEQTIVNQLISEVEALNAQTTEAANYASEQGNYAKEQGDYAKEQAEHISELTTGVLSVNGQSGIVSLGVADMDDTAISNPADKDMLVYDSDTSKWVNVPYQLQTNIQTLNDNDVLAYDADTSKWINVSIEQIMGDMRTTFDTVYAQIQHEHVLADVENGTEMTDSEVQSIWNATSAEGS